MKKSCENCGKSTYHLDNGLCNVCYADADIKAKMAREYHRKVLHEHKTWREEEL